jgi:hypothetical protein
MLTCNNTRFTLHNALLSEERSVYEIEKKELQDQVINVH